MSLHFGGLPMWQIGAEGGLFDRPVPVRHLVLSPAERADVLIDFRGLDGRTLELRNSTPAAPVSTPAPPLEAVMQVRVGTSVTLPAPGASRTACPASGPACPARARPGTSRSTRSLRAPPAGT